MFANGTVDNAQNALHLMRQTDYFRCISRPKSHHRLYAVYTKSASAPYRIYTSLGRTFTRHAHEARLVTVKTMQTSDTLKEFPKELKEIRAHSLDWGFDDSLYDSEHPPTVGQIAFELGVILAVCLALALAAHLTLLIGG